MSAAFVARTVQVPALPKVIAPVVVFSVQFAVPAPAVSAYVTAPVPEPPEVASVNALPNATAFEFVNVSVA